MDHLLKEYTGEKTVLNLMKQYKKEATAPIHTQLKAKLCVNWLIEQYLCGLVSFSELRAGD
jgi:hypothetical protein